MPTAKQRDAFWYSKIESYKHCPHKYRMQYVDGISAGVALSADLAFGTAVHGGLEAMLKGSDFLELFDLLWEHAGNQGLEYGRFNWEYLADCGRSLLSKFQKQHLKDIEVVKLEERLFGSMGPHKYEGTPDVIGLYKGVPSVMDFKTSAYRYDPDKIVVASQLFDYAVLARQNGVDPVPVQAVYFVLVKSSVSVQRPLIYPFEDGLLESCEARTVQWIEIIKQDSSLPRNTSGCIRGPLKCEYFDKCWRR